MIIIAACVNPKMNKETEKVFKELRSIAIQTITLFFKQVYLRKGLPFYEAGNMDALRSLFM